MRAVLFLLLLHIAISCPAQQTGPTPAPVITEAPTGFDGRSNGLVEDATHQDDLAKFDEFETVKDGLGPLYNAQSCRECHQNPQSGGGSQITELRVGHAAADGSFQNPSIPIGDGAEVVSGRSLVNDRAVCPSKDYPNGEIQERAPQTETIRTQRLSLSLLGDGFVEAVADQTLVDLALRQCILTAGKICGQAVSVPIVEAPGATRIGRFGWKDQHGSLLSFSGDAYLNEMGITTRLFPTEVTNLCNTVPSPNDPPDGDGLDDVDRFARFIRATTAPAPDAILSATAQAQRGAVVFSQIGCSVCHVSALVTAPAGSTINGGTFTIPPALGSKRFHPYGDFLMHDIGTGDGVLVLVQEHFGRAAPQLMAQGVGPTLTRSVQNKIRTAPLWGVRFRSRLMHDGASYTFPDAILRHGGEASTAAQRFFLLPPADQDAVLAFLRSL